MEKSFVEVSYAENWTGAHRFTSSISHNNGDTNISLVMCIDQSNIHGKTYFMLGSCYIGSMFINLLDQHKPSLTANTPPKVPETLVNPPQY